MKLIVSTYEGQRVGIYEAYTTTMWELIGAIVNTNRHFLAEQQPGWLVLIENGFNGSDRIQKAIKSALSSEFFGPTALKGIVAYSRTANGIPAYGSWILITPAEEGEVAAYNEFVKSPLRAFQEGSIAYWPHMNWVQQKVYSQDATAMVGDSDYLTEDTANGFSWGEALSSTVYNLLFYALTSLAIHYFFSC